MTDLPQISLVTPNLNGNRFLESCLRSVLDQDYPDLEYVVIDGLSTDDSLTTITKFESKLDHIVSEKDEGHYSAIEKGFGLSTGDVMGWLNSDDWLLPGSLRTVGEIFATYPDLRWLTTSYPLTMDSNNSLVRQRFIGGFNATTFYQGANLPFGNHYQRGNIQQESTFWRRSLWNDAGSSLSMNHGLAGDFELWSRFFKHADLHSVRSPIGAFRLHGDQLSIKSSGEYYNDAVGALNKHGGRLPNQSTSAIRRTINGIIGNGPANGRQPVTLVRLLRLSHLVTPAPIIYREPFNGWKLATEFIV